MESLATSPSKPSSSYRHLNPLSIPEGRAKNLPSVRIVDEKLESKRKIYGGKGDAKHLGGFTEIDMDGISPATWKYAVKNWTVQSVLDVGCGRGISTSWFVTHGLRTECVEGSHHAIQESMVPDKSILTEHDFSRGPWWPGKTFDMVWSVEFLEHVNLQFHYNYVSAFRKAAIIMVSSSNWGGWHHVEVHDSKWWIRKYESYGFRYDSELTAEIKKVAVDEENAKEIFPPNGKNIRAQHVWTTIKVFVNPVRKNCSFPMRFDKHLQYFICLLQSCIHGMHRIASWVAISFGFVWVVTPRSSRLAYSLTHLICTIPFDHSQAVAALPEHAHLFGELGCFDNYGKPTRECGKPANAGQKEMAEVETPLDPAFLPLVLKPEQDQAWYDIVKANIDEVPPE
jgi:hypothetical protein